MASALARITPPTLKPAFLPRRTALCVYPRYFSHVLPHLNARTPAISTPPVDAQSAEVQPERDDGDPMEIEEKEWENDDFTSSGHAELERHREARQYARITMYEMPRLSELAKPFVLPNSEQVLRFRYTTYLGEKHPAESKVVVEFSPQDLGLTPVQAEKLIKIAGVRYNPGTCRVKMSCEMFEQQAQNKRYLSDLVDTLIEEAKDPTDDFSDVPVDFRHYTARLRPPKPRFPAGWRLTERRREELAESRMALEGLFENAGGSA